MSKKTAKMESNIILINDCAPFEHITIRQDINSKRIQRLLQIVPKSFCQRIDALFESLYYNDFLLVLDEVEIKFQKETRHIILIRSASIAIDLFNNDEENDVHDFFYNSLPDEGRNYPYFGKDYSKGLIALELWRNLSTIIKDRICFNKEYLKYYPFSKVIKTKRGKKCLSINFVESLTDKWYYKNQGYIQSGCLIKCREDAKSLFGIKEDDIFINNHGFELFDNNVTEKEPPRYLYFYTDELIKKSVAVSEDGNIIRDVTCDFGRIEDGELRYIFFSRRWKEDYKIYFTDAKNKNSKKFLTFEQEADFPVIFTGLFKYNQRESIKEGCQVWERISEKVDSFESREEAETLERE